MTDRCARGMAAGTCSLPGSSGYLLTGPGKQARAADACGWCEHSAWHGPWAEAPLQTVEGFSLPVGDQRARPCAAQGAARTGETVVAGLWGHVTHT